MLARGLGRRLAVAPLQGGHDLTVFLQRLAHAVAQLQLQPAVGLEPVLQRQRLLHQKGVAAGLVNELVEVLVGVVVRVDVLGFALRCTFRQRGFHLVQHGGCRAPRCQARA